jgi:transcriptional regulator with XRE-family HTH domain
MIPARKQERRETMEYHGVRHWLRQLRLQKDLSQSVVGAMCGVSQAAYNNVERGYRNPSDAFKAKIAEALDFPVSRWDEEEAKRGPAG